MVIFTTKKKKNQYFHLMVDIYIYNILYFRWLLCHKKDFLQDQFDPVHNNQTCIKIGTSSKFMHDCPIPMCASCAVACAPTQNAINTQCVLNKLTNEIPSWGRKNTHYIRMLCNFIAFWPILVHKNQTFQSVKISFVLLDMIIPTSAQ